MIRYEIKNLVSVYDNRIQSQNWVSFTTHAQQ